MPPATKSEVYAKIVKWSEGVRERSPSLSTEQAIAKVYEQRPDLVEEYREADLDAFAAVEEPETPEVLGGEAGKEVAEKIRGRAEEIAKARGVSISKGYSLALADPEGQRLFSEYKALQGDDETAAIYKSAAAGWRS